MGDIVACEPVVRYIRETQPDSFIVLALDRRFRELADSHPDVDHTLALYCVSEWIRFAGTRFFDQVIDLNISGRTCAVCRVPWIPRGGTHGITYDNYYFMPNLLSAYSKSAGLPELSGAPKLYLDATVQAAVDKLELPAQFVVVHAGANEKRRTLPLTAWRGIRQLITDTYGIAMVEIGLEAEMNGQGAAHYRNLCGKLSILESAEVLRRTFLYVGTDSGPAHLANAVGAYGIIGLGSYHVFRSYMPYSGDYCEGRNCELVRYDGIVTEMPVERMYAAIERRMMHLGINRHDTAGL